MNMIRGRLGMLAGVGGRYSVSSGIEDFGLSGTCGTDEFAERDSPVSSLPMTHTIQVNNRRCPSWNPQMPCAN